MYNVCTALYNAVVSVYEQQMLIKRPKRGFLFIINIILSVKMPNRELHRKEVNIVFSLIRRSLHNVS